MVASMSTQQRKSTGKSVRRAGTSGVDAVRGDARGEGRQGSTCKALTTSGQPCKRRPVPGLTVCSSHGGGTSAAVRSAKRAVVKSRVAGLWGISDDDSSVSVELELQRLARNKKTDITALRIELGSDPDRYYGLLVESKTIEEFDIEGTIQSKSGSQQKLVKKAGVHPLVEELHKSEQELLSILRLLQDVTGGTDDGDVERIRMQTARETARLMKAFPGISVDDAALEVVRRG